MLRMSNVVSLQCATPKYVNFVLFETSSELIEVNGIRSDVKLGL